MIVEPEQITAAAGSMFTASEALYVSVKNVADECGKLDAAEFTGIAEIMEAARLWMDDYVAVHRSDIEDFAMFLAVHAETMVEVDEYAATDFDQYAGEFSEFRGDAPAPVRPGPDPEDQMPRDGLSVAV